MKEWRAIFLGTSIQYKKALEIAPNDDEIYSLVSNPELHLDDFKGAIISCKRLRINPQDTTYLYHRAITKS